MDRRHLEYFLAVAEQGSFTRTAAALSIAQPSLSHAIALLERDLGSQLVDRDGRGSRLTQEGEVLLEPARHALRSSSSHGALSRRDWRPTPRPRAPGCCDWTRRRRRRSTWSGGRAG